MIDSPRFASQDMAQKKSKALGGRQSKCSHTHKDRRRGFTRWFMMSDSTAYRGFMGTPTYGAAQDRSRRSSKSILLATIRIRPRTDDRLARGFPCRDTPRAATSFFLLPGTSFLFTG
jgi:hypothetical protein